MAFVGMGTLQQRWGEVRGEPRPLSVSASASATSQPALGSNPRPLHRQLEELARAGPAQPALLPAPGAAGPELTLGELDAAASRLARAIVRRVRAGAGVPGPDGDWLLAVRLPPSPALVALLLGAWKAGAAYLPLDVGFPAARTRHILGEARPALLVREDGEGDSSGDGDCAAVSLSQLQAEAAAEPGEPLTEAEMLAGGGGGAGCALAFVLYTSGSTGVPKGVRVPQRALLNRLLWQWRRFPYSPSERVCVFKTALTFVDSACEMWGPLLRGRALLVLPRAVARDPAQLAQLLADHQVERLVLVPSLLRALLLQLEAEPRPLPRLRLWVCSGETLSVALARHFFRRFPAGQHALCNFYGSTEVMGDVTYHVITHPDQLDAHETVPIGLPLDHTRVYLLDAEQQPVAAGERGQLFVAGRNLALGYVRGRDPARFSRNHLTADPDYSLLYCTGDYARLHKDVLLYEGRTDSQVKIRGHRVDLSEVDRAVAAVPDVDKGTVLCYRPSDMEQILLAFVTVTDPGCSALDIEAELKKKLTSYMVPQVVILENIPLLVNGKIDRQLLLKNFDEAIKAGVSQQRQFDYSGVPEEHMAAARALFDTVAAVLGGAAVARLSLQANFYELGGNSLNSIFTVTQLKKRGFTIGIRDFVSAATLSDIIQAMRPEGNNTEQKNNFQYHLKENFTSEMLNDTHRSEVYRIIASSFYEKADLERWLIPEISREDYVDLMDKLWAPLVEKGLSFTVKNGSSIAGVALNFDAYDEPEVEITNKLNIIFDFLEFLEGPIRNEKLPKGKGHVFHSFMMGTHESLSSAENIKVIQFMEEEVLRIAKDKRFTGIFTTNTSPLTQQLSIDVHKYKVLQDFQVNAYVAPDGSKPFGAASNDQRAICCWKTV